MDMLKVLVRLLDDLKDRYGLGCMSPEQSCRTASHATMSAKDKMITLVDVHWKLALMIYYVQLI